MENLNGGGMWRLARGRDGERRRYKLAPDVSPGLWPWVKMAKRFALKERQKKGVRATLAGPVRLPFQGTSSFEFSTQG
jgi:hypothetical protein